MQIKIDLKILVFLLIFSLTGQIRLYILLMIFACIHELGHLITGLFFKFKPSLFEIKPIGFSVSFDNPIKDYNKKILKSNVLECKKIIIYSVGPLLNFLIALIIFYININQNLKVELIYINLILGIINLIPIYPLDGGRIFKSTICLFKGIKDSYIWTEGISSFFIVILLILSSFAVLYFKNIGIVIIVLYLLYIKIRESRRIENKLRLYKALLE